jgi:hypothetical protein
MEGSKRELELRELGFTRLKQQRQEKNPDQTALKMRNDDGWFID